MKTLLLLSSCFVFSFLQAQNNYPFPHQNAVWGQFNGVCCFPGLTGGTYFLASAGDTIVNGNTYFKINYSDSAGVAFTGINTMLREDSSGKIFQRYLNDTIEFLLYDFGVSEGDTVYLNYDDCAIIIDSIRTISLGSETRKVVFPRIAGFANCFPTGGGGHFLEEKLMWIEGIGSNAGLLYPSGGEMVDGMLWLTCFRENDTLKYGSVCNEFYTGIGNPSGKQELAITPNPTDGRFEIKISNAIDVNCAVKVYNSVGKCVLQETPRFSEPGFRMDISSQPDGFYFVEISSGKHTASAKVLLAK